MTDPLPVPAVVLPPGSVRPIRARRPALAYGPARRTVVWSRRAAGLPPLGVAPAYLPAGGPGRRGETEHLRPATSGRGPDESVASRDVALGDPVSGRRSWLLGASDPEMERIEALLRDAGEPVAHATVLGRAGRPARVHPGNAYQAAAPALSAGTTCVVLVECDAPMPSGVEVVRVDHHRPGDPGYGRGPEEFLPASSLGQVISLVARDGSLGALRQWPAMVGYGCHGEPGRVLRWRHAIGQIGATWGVALGDGAILQIPEDLVLAAAADHCLAAGHQGRCPGVDPDALATWRDATRAAYQRRPVEAVRADRERAEVAIAAAPHIDLGGVAVADLRALGAVPELPEASARLGVAVLYRLLPGDPGGDRGDRIKVGILGAGEGTPAGTAPVEAFLGGWAAAQGLVDTYPSHERTSEGLRAAASRGYAGGYES